MGNRQKTWTAEILTVADLNAEFNNIYTGTIDRTAGRWGSNDDIPVTFGSSQDAFLEFNTDQTNDCLAIVVDSTSNNAIFVQNGDESTNYAHANSTNPTLWIHSADQTATGDYIALFHDQTDAKIAAGTSSGLKVGVNASTVNHLFTSGGALLMNETANGDQTIGLTINMGANDDQAFALKSSDVGHPFTGVYEEDTYFVVRKVSGDQGGASIQGLNDGGSGDTAVAMTLMGYASANITGKTNSDQGVVSVVAHKTDGGTGTGANDANANLMVIRDSTNTRFIFDAEGDSHEDGTGWTAFDDYDDVDLLNRLDRTLDSRLREQWIDFLDSNKEMLSAARIVHFNDDGHHFVNRSKLQNLLVGAVRQLSERLEALECQHSLGWWSRLSSRLPGWLRYGRGTGAALER